MSVREQLRSGRCRVDGERHAGKCAALSVRLHVTMVDGVSHVPTAYDRAVDQVDRPEGTGASLVRLLQHRAADGDFWIGASGSSMCPSILEGDALLVEAVGRGPRRGEVWLHCDASGGLLAHRMVRRRGDAVVFRGDARDASDAPVLPERIIGRVTTLRRAGRAQRVSRSPVVAAYARIAWGRLTRWCAR